MFKTSEGSCFLGKTLVMTNGFIEVEVTTDVGPRIISLRKRGFDNIMYQDELDEVNHDCSAVYGPGEKWHIYGGHRIWLSPESEETYYPDNNPVHVEILPNGAIFTSDPWRVVNVQPSLKIEFVGHNELRIGNIVTNLASEPRLLCVWALTVCKTGAKLSVPFNTTDTGYLANRNLVVWPYTNLQDERLTITNEDVQLRSVRHAKSNIKIGMYLERLVTVYENNGTKLIKRLPPAAPPECYPDFCCNMETYTSGIIHEVETLSPRRHVAAGGSIEHVEFWEVI